MLKRSGAKIPWSRPLGDLVQPVIDPVLARRGFGPTGLVLYWDDIVGERLAAMSRPVKVQWPQRQRSLGEEDGSALATLIVRVETGFALELQHLAPVIVERANAHFGWRCIARLVLMQGPVEARPAARRATLRPPDKAAEVAAAKCAGDDLNEPLRQALIRLGTHILAGT